jgi:uncharacterized membrane-anchored protein
MISHLTRTRLFWGFVIFQLLFLGGIVALKERTLASGTTVILRTQPVDPVDIVRGNYVTLNYEISQVATIDRVQQGDTVYVALTSGTDNVKTATQAYESTRDIPDGQLFIQGVVANRDDSTISVDFSNIESYYAAKEEAQEIEKTLAGGALALIALDKNGEPTLCSVEGSTNWDASKTAAQSNGCSGAF